MSTHEPTAEAEAQVVTFWLMTKFTDTPPLPYGGWNVFKATGYQNALDGAVAWVNDHGYPADEVHIYKVTDGFPAFVFNHILVVRDIRDFISEYMHMEYTNEQVMANGLNHKHVSPEVIIGRS